ncbi:hypothetical protein SEA_ESKETIT_45 [Streptomyces phage Esketit]|uniref:Uncharacterized protein n=6 Tax=Rimavirus rima TaxID=2560784 RepID=A0A515MIP8_9CAUD|nr:hypothetical protein SEA_OLYMPICHELADO_45 [Streptomyces phage OlympicHelado]ASU04040.1 hypothetical protein SEA_SPECTROPATRONM_45 [Streptomyces phage Spectropatronm]QAY16256.1 hypothetical protein SEA_ICEWARRIOR_44 [Streptomyces phage IceWarrior]QDM56546.1 hypothetical protein SEA_ESKETIT_45 [Streptomyces phage Esketit]QEQ94261.1 hypothetical protein SEA_HOSHI_44 [Streptomyces phage Hoshi]QGJ96744.1 hypothetical protein SEA_FIDGETORCA_45 [Streptomyces phage FidgetOrca]
MFGEVMGKTKNQLRREVLMMKLRQLKRHIPAIAGAVGTIAATAIAVHYKHEAEKHAPSGVDPDWQNLPIPRHMAEALEDGHTLHYRQVRIDDDNCYSQYTTSKKSLGFNPEMDQRFEEAKKERDNA